MSITESIGAKVMKGLTWHFTGKEGQVFLTFDDGPTLEITPWVLSILKQFNAKATFFCIGKKVEKHPELFNRILEEGHSVGNHSYTHTKGWKTNVKRYVQDVKKASVLINSKLFRPPYGKIRPRQLSQLKKDYNIIMWDIFPQDYNKRITKDKCLKVITDYTGSGSIIVLHDTQKAEKKLKYVLPIVLEHFSKKGYVFNPINFM